MSVGMANLYEIREAYEIMTGDGDNLALLHCVSAYPTEEKDANLGAIKVLQEKFDKCVIGQSDHTTGIKVPLFAVAQGAQIIEKHYMITDDMECVDAPVSISEKGMNDLVKEIRNLEQIIGDSVVDITDVQQSASIFRRPTA